MIAGPAHILADLIPSAEIFEIAGREFLKAVGDRSFQNRGLEFSQQAHRGGRLIKAWPALREEPAWDSRI